MNFATVGDARKYFEDVERRYENGSLLPTSEQGASDRDRLLLAIADIAELIKQKFDSLSNCDKYLIKEIEELLQIRTKLVFLLGKFEGFSYCQTFLVAKAGNQANYFN